ncbi:MAG: DUF1566 domain-containing protein, partial [Deltaproteobacteria bacterium]|nr:DUF1566 domain-containing protein [Deltaproteobacteria bacterium]
PYDLRYQEKIVELASKRSREVISFGDKHWPGSKQTEGFGLFTYYIRKALMDNWFKIIDLENLIFDEEIIFQIRKVAGTRLLRGRLRKSPMEKGGQAIITRVISPPPINITDTYVNPKKGFAGDKFIIEAETNRPAFEVYVDLNGKKYLMDGDGSKWRHSIKVASIGTSAFKVLAINEDDIEGTSLKGEFTTIRPLTNMVNVETAQVSPNKGQGGDEFQFTAKTDSPAKKVILIIGENRYDMTGSGTDWSIKQKIEDTGSVAFSMVALNEDGFEGRSKGDTLSIKAPPVSIVKVETSPREGYAGDEFLINAGTDHPARSVTLELDGVTYEMQGSGKDWSIKRSIPDVGTKKFAVIAKNMDGVPGPSKSGEILTSKRPLAVPDVLTVSLSPEKIRAEEDFVIRAKTSAAAEAVFVDLQGKQQPMEGSDTEWKYSTRIASVGSTDYKITAKNKDGKEGRAKEGKIIIIEKAPKGVDVVKAEVSPEQGNIGQTFSFSATTSAPAATVTAVIGDKKYKMTGSGTDWSLKKEISDLGTVDFYIVAADNKGDEGSSKGGSLLTKALPANVLDVKATSDNGYAGEEFLFIAGTDNPAKTVSLRIDGITYEMEGEGKEWSYKKTIHDVGKKTFTVIARNIEGASGTEKKGELLTTLPVPDVITVTFSPENILAGDDFVIKVKTNEIADKVYVEINGKQNPMDGAGTDWSFLSRIDDLGSSSYKILAKNRLGTQGKTKEGTINIAKKASPLVNIAKAEVSPQEGYAGGAFVFKAVTDRSALGVSLSIAGKDYKMTGSGTEWSLTEKIMDPGSVVFSIVAINQDNVEGVAKTAEFVVQEIKERYTYNQDGTITDKVTGKVKDRFKDNGDGTITDLATNLMWLQTPKRVAVGYDEAEEYCRDLSVEGYSGWRLPTAYEWRDIIDKAQKAPALPPGHPFKNIVYSIFFWSKTPHQVTSQRIYVADLYTGKIGAQSKNNQYIVWPVRYAEEVK